MMPAIGIAYAMIRTYSTSSTAASSASRHMTARGPASDHSTTPTTTPQMTESIMAWPRARWLSARSPAPIARAMSACPPMPRPVMAIMMNQVMYEPMLIASSAGTTIACGRWPA